MALRILIGPAGRNLSTESDCIVLAGMMGTGKTSVGQWLARSTGRTFVDTDNVLALREGVTVADLFSREGEATFRTREAQTIASLAGTTGAVVATGGWAIADPASRRALEALGPVIVLSASPLTLAERLAGSSRPSLPRPTEAAVADALRERSRVYDSFALHVGTDARTVAEVGAIVLDLVTWGAGGAAEAFDRLVSLPVASPAGSYRVVIGSGLLGRSGGHIDAALAPRSVFIVSEPVVARLHLDILRAGFGRWAPTKTTVALLPSGEAAKDLAHVHALYEQMSAAGLERDDVVVALGGGAIGDTAGFAAATYLRGVRLVHVPTTLLAMVDSSIGGKTGVDLGMHKNIVGAFHDPALVLTDPSMLATLPFETLSEGMAEVIKAAMVGDAALFDDLESGRAWSPTDPATTARAGDRRDRPGDPAGLASLVSRAVAVKAGVVGRDPREHGERAVLNLGHTFAHAIEAATGHHITHGRAVAVGLVAACRLAERGVGAPSTLAQRVEAVVTGCGLPTSVDADPDAILAAMTADKKRRGGRPRFVLPTEIGQVVLTDDVSEADIVASIRSVTRAAQPA